MLMLLSGELLVTSSSSTKPGGRPDRFLNDGMFYCESSLLLDNQNRGATVMATTNVEVYFLRRTDYKKVD